MFLVFSNYFDMLMLKIIYKNKKILSLYIFKWKIFWKVTVTILLKNIILLFNKGYLKHKIQVWSHDVFSLETRQPFNDTFDTIKHTRIDWMQSLKYKDKGN